MKSAVELIVNFDFSGSENNSFYIVEDTTANQPAGRLEKGTVLLDNVKNSIKKLRDFDKAKLKKRYILKEKV